MSKCERDRCSKREGRWARLDHATNGRPQRSGWRFATAICVRPERARRHQVHKVSTLRYEIDRFFFYSADRTEPPHVHVERETNRAKFWLTPVRLARSGGFGAPELLRLERLVNERQAFLLGAWDEYFTANE